MSLPSRLLAATSTLALGVTGLTGLAGAAAAPAETPSTPVPVSTPDGQLSSYVVNVATVNPGQVRKAERAVQAAGGVVVQTWAEIGVIIAHARTADFRTRVVAEANGAVASIGPTRTTGVSEGTPAGVPSPWGPGKGQGKVKPKPADPVEDAPVPPPTPDEHEALQYDMQMMRVPQAHAVTTGSRAVTVGVLDDGIDPDHPDLDAQIDPAQSVSCISAGRPDTAAGSWWPTSGDHGTHVAGTIAAERNGVGIVGVAPGVRLASVKVVNDDGWIYPEYAICGFMWAGQKGMEVTNSSFFVDPFRFWCGDQPEQAPALEAMRRAVAWASSRGTVHAAGAANDAYDLAHKTTDATSPADSTPVPRTLSSACKVAPAELEGVVTVSSVDQQRLLSPFSNRGLGVIDVAAPGSRILSTVIRDNGWAYKSGTSMASPHVAGVLALMTSAHPELTAAQRIDRLRAQAVDHPCTATTRGAACEGTTAENSYYGEGIADALAAVR